MNKKIYKFNEKNILTLKEKLILFKHSNFFSVFSTTIIILYAIVLGMESVFKNNPMLNIFLYLDNFITYFFAFEIALRLYAEPNKVNFFKNRWNLFDFIVVAISLIPLSLFQSIAILRVLRVIRILRLISINDGIKKILISLEGAIPSILDIVILMFIIFYIYAVIGTQLFSGLESGLWKNFPTAMLTLFRVLTFEDWTDVMYEAMEVYPYSWIYFVSFIIITAFIVFNLFVAVIIDEMSKIKDNNIKSVLEDEQHQILTVLKELKEIKEELKLLKNKGENNVAI